MRNFNLHQQPMSIWRHLRALLQQRLHLPLSLRETRTFLRKRCSYSHWTARGFPTCLFFRPSNIRALFLLHSQGPILLRGLSAARGDIPAYGDEISIHPYDGRSDFASALHWPRRATWRLFGPFGHQFCSRIHSTHLEYGLRYNMLVNFATFVENRPVSELLFSMQMVYEKFFFNWWWIISSLIGLVAIIWMVCRGLGPRRIFTTKPVESGSRDYLVQAGYNARQAWLFVENMGNVSGRSPGPSTHLNTMPLLYLGMFSEKMPYIYFNFVLCCYFRDTLYIRMFLAETCRWTWCVELLHTAPWPALALGLLWVHFWCWGENRQHSTAPARRCPWKGRRSVRYHRVLRKKLPE